MKTNFRQHVTYNALGEIEKKKIDHVPTAHETKMTQVVHINRHNIIFTHYENLSITGLRNGVMVLSKVLP